MNAQTDAFDTPPEDDAPVKRVRHLCRTHALIVKAKVEPVWCSSPGCERRAAGWRMAGASDSAQMTQEQVLDLLHRAVEKWPLSCAGAPETSEEAAEIYNTWGNGAKGWRLRVAGAIALHGDRGLTDGEGEDLLGYTHFCSRRCELRDVGLVYETTKRRTWQRTGFEHVVWVAVPMLRQVLKL